MRAAGIQVVIAPHRRWRPGDFEGWLRPGRAVYAESVLTTAEVIARIEG